MDIAAKFQFRITGLSANVTSPHHSPRIMENQMERDGTVAHDMETRIL